MNSVKASRYFRKDLKLARWILIAMAAISTIITALFPDAYYITIYFTLYMLLGLAIFWMASKWLCTITLFYVLYTLDVGCGIYFFWMEKVIVRYEPYLVVLGGLAMMALGYFIGQRNKLRVRIRLKHLRYVIPISRLTVLYASYLLSTMACIWYFLENFALLRGDLNNGRITAMSGNGWLFYLVKLHTMIIPLMYEECKKRKMDKRIFTVLFFFSCIQLLVTGFRSPAATMIVIMLIIDIYRGKLNLRKALPIVLLLFTVLVAYGAWRNKSNLYNLYTIARSQLFVCSQNLNRVFAVFPKKVSFQYGYTYLINLIMLRPGPDLDFTLWLKDRLQVNFSGGGVTPTILGEFYINFGYIGIYIGMLIFGFLVEKIDKWIIKGEITFWKAYIMFLLASSCSGGIANVYLNPLIFGLYYWLIIKPTDLRRNERKKLNTYTTALQRF